MSRTTYRPQRPNRAGSDRQQPPAFKRGVLAALVIAGLLLGAIMSAYVYADDLLDRFDRSLPAGMTDEQPSLSLKLSDIVAYEDKSGLPDTAGTLDELRREQTTVREIDIRSENGVRNVLLILSDAWDEKQVNRPDAIVLLTIAHGTDQVRMTTILNTMAVDIPQKGWSMLSHAYSWGGPELLCETIEDNFRIDLSDYLVIDMTAIESAIDRVGGIELDLDEPEVTYLRKNFPYQSFKKGETEMDGELAVAFSRTRLSEAEMDRLDRQQRVALALIDKAQSLSQNQLTGMAISTFPKIHTNLTKSQLFDLMTDGYKARQYDVRQLTIPTEGAYESFVFNQVRMTRVDLMVNVKALQQFVFGEDS